MSEIKKLFDLGAITFAQYKQFSKVISPKTVVKAIQAGTKKRK